MDAWIYRGGQTVWDDEHRPIRLEYYLQREVRDVRTGTCIYGIRVEQYREIGGRTSYEEETAPALSYSGRQVAGLIEKLRRLSVTPTGCWRPWMMRWGSGCEVRSSTQHSALHR